MNPSTTKHPDQTQLTAFLGGQLSEADRLSVERHVEQCDDCCRAMSELPQDTLSGKLLDVDTDVDDVALAVHLQTQPTEVETGIPAALIDHPRYRILGPLGQGGMGMVYKAQHRMMDREVALKVIDAKFINNPQAIERFRNEVKAAACLTHANIVRAYDAEQAGELHFLVMEFVDGISLAELIRRNGPLPVHQVCGIIRKVAQGLHHAFEHGMVHRDIKPQNIMVTLDGRVRILDFGLARLAREREEPVCGAENPSDKVRRTADALTLVGSVLGTPDYIAPEQVMDAHAADTRADIYSLGCTCYFLLTGHPPYPDGTAVQKLMAHAEMSPSPIAAKRPDVPREVIELTAQMMARLPDDRFQTPRDIAKAVDEFMKAGPSSTAETAETAVQSGQATFAIIDRKQPGYSDFELSKVDLSAISVEDSELQSSVPKASAQVPNSFSEPSLETQQPASQREPARERASVSRPRKTVASRRKPAKRVMIRQSRTEITGVFLVIAAALGVTGLILFPRGNNDAPSDSDSAVANVTTALGEIPSANTATAFPAAAGSGDDWVNLLPMVNLRTAMAGRWRMNDGELSVNRARSARIDLPVDVPDEYDFEVTFTRDSGEHSIALIFARNGRQATLDIDAWAQNLAGIHNINGVTCEFNATRVTGYRLVNDQRYTARLNVRRDRVEAFLDGELITTYNGDGSNLSLIPSWRLRRQNSIGLGAYDSATTFHSVRFRPVTAKR